MADEGIGKERGRPREDTYLIPVMGWGATHAVTFGATQGRNSAAIADATKVCSIRSVSGDAHFLQGDVTVAATASYSAAIYLPADEWVEVTTASTKYISFIQASGSSAVQAQIVERV